MNDAYIEVISLTERLHRQFLEVVKLELEGLRIHDINNVQALILFNIGEAEMTVGELTLRGCYLGSNVTYNVKKMGQHGYLEQRRSLHDRRSVHVRLTEKGKKLRDNLMAMHQRHDERRSLLFKTLQVVRFFDRERNVLVYVAYSNRIIEGSPKNSISSVPIMNWPGTQASASH